MKFRSHRQYWLALGRTLVWVVLTFGLYGFRLAAGWRFDDGHHLAFLAAHSHFEYLYDPAAARLQSGAHFTPFNILTYDLPHRVASFQHPAAFYAFALMLLGLAAAAFHTMMRRFVAEMPAALASLVFLIGFPIAGMSGQLMVGHYLVGIACSALCIATYDAAAARDRLSASSLLWYLLACVSKEIFIPIALIPAIDPRTSSLLKARACTGYAAVAASFLILRTIVLGQLVGGYMDVSAQSPLASAASVVSGITTYFLLNEPQALAGVFVSTVLVGSVIVLWRRFGASRAMTMFVGITALVVLPLMPVAAHVGPAAPTEVRLLTMFWVIVSLCCGIVAHAVASTGRRAALMSMLTVSFVAPSTVWSLNYSPLAQVERRFDAWSEYVLDQRKCSIVDDYGLSSWAFDLHRAVWPGIPQPVAAPGPLIAMKSPAGTPICGWSHGSIRVIAGPPPSATCDEGPLAVTLRYEAGRVHFDFGPDDFGPYYLDVSHSYVLTLPRSYVGAMPDSSRFRDIRVFRVLDSGHLACSPRLSFDPSKRAYLHWERPDDAYASAAHARGSALQ